MIDVLEMLVRMDPSDIAIRLLEPLKAEFPILSYADFYPVMIFLSLVFVRLMMCLCWRSWLALLPLRSRVDLKFHSTLEERYNIASF